MTDKRDLGIAVADALRLNDCYHELAEAIASRPSIKGDEALWWSNRATNVDSPEMEDWIHRGKSQNVAESILSATLRDGGLKLWVRRSEGEFEVDRQALKEMNHRTFAAGAYKPINDLDSELVGRPLWIRRGDWTSFLRRTLEVRYGESVIDASQSSQLAPSLDHVVQERLASRSDKMRPWLNPFELVAWVQYRDLGVVALANDWNGLAAEHLYGKKSQVGIVTDLEVALQEGRLKGHGQKQGEEFALIQPVEWTRIRLAPLNPIHQRPYVCIQFWRDDVLVQFPPIGSILGANLDDGSVHVISTGKTENECRDWLRREFAADPRKNRTKAEFRKAAMVAFAGRLTERGFNLRVWPTIAQADGRVVAGAKKKS